MESLLITGCCALALSTSAMAAGPLAITGTDKNIQWAPCPPFFEQTCRLGVLHGNPAEPNADVFFRLDGGEAFPTHTHSSAERMVLVQGKLRVEYEGHDAVTLEPGTYAYGPAEMPHKGQCLSEERCILFIAFEAPVDAFAVD
ncbi:cupin domain-containing protein [Halioglobus maricola]|uniref:Cupin domain-containing protein n=2 Tax=Halioglobus maricola TaxID=2601894 RepID=A0A5P9NPX4_9GAMM|nr:cupin domain-containing protein [Halioglobus maricola]